LAEKVFNNCETEEIQLFVGTARLLWLRRNDVVFGKMLQHPTEVAKRAKRHVEEFLQASENRNMDAPSVAVQRDRRWRAPEEGWLKANWDASSARSQDRLGFGVVVRTENGTVVAAQSKTLEATLQTRRLQKHMQHYLPSSYVGSVDSQRSTLRGHANSCQCREFKWGGLECDGAYDK
jgi:hypothetical protein